MANKVTTVFDAVDKGFHDSLKRMTSAMDEAHGFVGKFKAGIGGLKDGIADFISSPLGAAAAVGTAGAAIAEGGRLAFDAVKKFSDLGVEIGNFATATGLSTEQASRWVEVAGDLGVDTDTLEGAIGKMNKALGNTPGAFKEAGVEIARTSSGAVDANGTFLNVIDKLKRMKDPAAQAALGAKLLGKGWQSMAELINAGSGTLSESLAKVSDIKVFSPEEVEKAKKFRDTMAELHDQFEDLAIAAGEKLAPAMTELAGGLTKAANKEIDMINLTGELFSKVSHPLGHLGFVQEFADKLESIQSQPITETDRETRKLALSIADVTAMTDLAAAAELQYKADAENTKRAVKQAIDEMAAKWGELTGDVNDDKSWITLQGQFDEVKQKFVDANDAIKNGTDDAAAKTRDYKGSLDDLILSTIGYGKSVLDIPPEKLVEIKATLNAGDLALAEQQLTILTRNRDVNLSIIAKGGAGFGAISGARASGGPVNAGEAYTVGERGRETFVPDTNGTIVPNGVGGGMNVTVNVSTGPFFSATDMYRAGQMIKNAIAEYDRRNG